MLSAESLFQEHKLKHKARNYRLSTYHLPFTLTAGLFHNDINKAIRHDDDFHDLLAVGVFLDFSVR